MTDRERKDAALVCAAVSYWTGKESNRDLLDAGSQTPIKGTIAATLDGKRKTRLAFGGTLIVNYDETVAKSSAVDAARLVAYLLAHLPKSKRLRILEDLPAKFSTAGDVPDAPDDIRTEADRLLKRLRSTKSGTKRGAIRFEPTT